MKKRILTFVLSLVMILSCVSASAFAEGNAVVATENWYTEADTLYIRNASDLLAFASVLYDGHTTGNEFEGKTVYLCNDIVLNTGDASTWGTTPPTNSYNSFKGGSSTGWFKGTFDGQGHVISGLYQKVTGSGVGLIPYTSESATIKNVTIANSYFECAKTDGGLASAITCEYKSPTTEGACFAIENVHVKDTHVIGNYGVAGVLAFMNTFSVKNVQVKMNNITFVGGKIEGGPQSGGIIGRIYHGGTTAAYENGVTMNMDKIVVDSTLTFTNSSETDNVNAGGVIGHVSGFRKIDMTNIMVNGSLTIVGNKEGSTPFIGHVTSSATTQGTVDGVDEVATINISNAVAVAQLTNVRAYLCTRQVYHEEHPIVKMTNIRSDKEKVTEGADNIGRKVQDGKNDTYPSGSEHKYSTAELQGENSVALFDGWMITGENSYPIPTARPARLLGYQTTYKADVTDENDATETYSVRLIAALNDDFYTFAGFDNISITYTDNGEQTKEKATYYCQYAYTSVIGVDKDGEEETYNASDYGATRLIALVITGIPESVTEFEITLNAFAGNGNVSIAGLTKTVEISAVQAQ